MPRKYIGTKIIAAYPVTPDDPRGDGKAAADKAFKHAGGPCNYTGGGLFRLNPVEVDFEDGSEPMQAFAFAELTPNDRVEGRDAASSRRVPSHDGLCGAVDTEF